MATYTKRKPPTKEQQDKAAAKREAFHGMVKTFAAMPPAQQCELMAKVPGLLTVDGRLLSIVNSCMVAMQCPTATMVGGFAQWLKVGRAVKKGETGLSIWVPIKGKAKEGDEPAAEEKDRKMKFMVGTVFDVSQTQDRE